jgi:uncharacterized repeat protein (TIGR01451 family)
MPIRKSLAGFLALMVLGSSGIARSQDDPFAEWDRLNPRKPATTSRATKKTTMYFAPSSGVVAEQAGTRTEAGGETGSATAAAAAARKPAIPLRERIAARPADTNSSTAATAPAGNSNIKPAVATQADEVSTSNVTRATYERQPDERPPIRQVSGRPEQDTFDEFLKAGGGSAVEASAGAPEDEFESGEPLLLKRRAAGTAPTAAARPSPAQASSKSTAVKPVSGEVRTAMAEKPAAGEQTGPQSPGVTVQWVRKSSFNVGQECDVELVVENSSRAVVRSVMTEAAIPEGVEVIDATPAPMAGADAPSWTFGELQPGETRTVALKLKPTQRGDVRLDAFVRLTGYSSSEFAVEEPMIGVSVAGPESVEVGEQAGYVVRVSNPGTGIASNVVIQAAIPEGLEHRGGSLLTIDIGTLNPGESRQARLSLTATKGGAHELAVRALADGGLSDQSSASVAVAEPQLHIDMNGPSEHVAGRTADYSLTVTNTGKVPSANVRAKYRIPEGYEFVSADRGGKYAEADHSIEWFVGTVQPGEDSGFTVTLKAVGAGELLHQAGVISEHGRVTMCDLVTEVQGTAALDLKLVADSKSPRVGEEVQYSVTIRNTGSRAANSVGLSCELPSGLELIDASGPSEHIAENGVMVFRSVKSIEPGESAEFTIKARCTREGSLRLRLRVASESITEPLIGEEALSVSAR